MPSQVLCCPCPVAQQRRVHACTPHRARRCRPLCVHLHHRSRIACCFSRGVSLSCGLTIKGVPGPPLPVALCGLCPGLVLKAQPLSVPSEPCSEGCRLWVVPGEHWPVHQIPGAGWTVTRCTEVALPRAVVLVTCLLGVVRAAGNRKRPLPVAQQVPVLQNWVDRLRLALPRCLQAPARGRVALLTMAQAGPQGLLRPSPPREHP